MDKIAAKRIAFVKSHGYKNISVFARAVGEHPSNVHKVLKGQQLPRIEKLFTYAAFLDVDMSQILGLFYPEQMKHYKDTRKALKEAAEE